MMNKKMIPLMLLAGLMSAPASAQDEAPARYASLSSLNWQLEGNFAEGSGIRLVLGQQLSDYLSMELHGGMGGDDNVTLMTTGPTPVAVNGELGLDQLVGGYVRASYPVNDRVSLYGLLGYTRVKAEFEGDANFTAGSTPLNRDSFSESESGHSYGGGIEFDVFSSLMDGRLRLTADYMLYLDKSGSEFEARSVGVKLEF
ncbi:porin family protein [Flagellatimonas centrodinii]|uniref:outer membrane beta-barrel protein n=1 Tax=Flagellatimonas centrodinii TaxID=2806210 RepID=UPI001FEF9110|nr:outer membrane beta-barrel protein [Flagellatimonas centrodinii]ULQ47665.1 porin family protein [Flagellatimonas centrodinii]